MEQKECDKWEKKPRTHKLGHNQCNFTQSMVLRNQWDCFEVTWWLRADLKRYSDMFLGGFLEFIVPLENFSLIWRRHHCRWRAANFDLCSALMALEQWGFLSMPHLLWYGPTVYNGHLWGPVTLTYLQSVWQWSCHYLFLRLRSVVNGYRSLYAFECHYFSLYFMKKEHCN